MRAGLFMSTCPFIPYFNFPHVVTAGQTGGENWNSVFTFMDVKFLT